MPKKEWTDEERKAFAEKMKASRQAKQEVKETPVESQAPVEPQEDTEDHIAGDPDVEEMKRQLKEAQESIALLKQLALQGNQSQGVQMNRNGELVGEFEKYLVDPINYPDPTPRLRKEPRLQPLAFDYNYELEYEVGVSAYETKTGKNIREPKFKVQLNRIVIDDQGNQTDKRYIARKLVFHEDPQAALVIARDNGIEIDQADEPTFLNEMRYLRVRDWLFDIFWPRPADEQGKIKEEVIGGTVVQVFTKASEESGSIPFDQLQGKVRG